MNPHQKTRNNWVVPSSIPVQPKPRLKASKLISCVWMVGAMYPFHFSFDGTDVVFVAHTDNLDTPVGTESLLAHRFAQLSEVLVAQLPFYIASCTVTVGIG